jgi:5'-methylthioadenosine phosphorylase
MTQVPEAALAAELGLCYCGIALVTDYDSGVENDPTVLPVTMEQVFARFEANVERVRDLLLELIPMIPDGASCGCAARRGPIESLPSD